MRVKEDRHIQFQDYQFLIVAHKINVNMHMHTRTHTQTHHIDPSVQPMMYPVIPDDRVTPRPNLHTGQRVAVNIIVLQDTTPTSKEVHAPLETGKYLVVQQGGVAFAGDPYPGVGVGENPVLNELPSTLE